MTYLSNVEKSNGEKTSYAYETLYTMLKCAYPDFKTEVDRDFQTLLNLKPKHSNEIVYETKDGDTITISVTPKNLSEVNDKGRTKISEKDIEAECQKYNTEEANDHREFEDWYIKKMKDENYLS